MAMVLFGKDGGLTEVGSEAPAAPARVDMDDLLKSRREIMHRKHGVYRRVLELCHRRIRFNARRRPDCTWCVFQIPSFVPGLPRYNLDGCTRYCLSKLRQNGFELTFVPPQTFVISWQKYERDARRRAKARRRRAERDAAAAATAAAAGSGRRRGRRGGAATAGAGRPRRRDYLSAAAPRFSGNFWRRPRRPPAFEDDR